MEQVFRYLADGRSGFTGKKPVLYQGGVLHGAEKLVLCIRERLDRLRKTSCFVSGNDFSRANKPLKMKGFSPCALLRQGKGTRPSGAKAQWIFSPLRHD
jgi:hypothetical protein